MAERRPRFTRQTSRKSLQGRTLLKQGYLKKIPHSGLAAVVKKSQERWFVFGVNALEPFLEYYENEDSVFTTAPINTISLATCRMVSNNVLDVKNANMFTITTSERQLNLVAKDRADMFRWCDVIKTKLGEIGIIQDPHSLPNIYEDLPVHPSHDRARRPLPQAPESSQMNLSSPDAHSGSRLPHNVYENTSLSLSQKDPPPLPPRHPASRDSSRTSISDDLSSDFEDPFDALAISRTVVTSPKSDEGQVTDILDIVLTEDNNNSTKVDKPAKEQDLSTLGNAMRVEITPDLTKLIGLHDEGVDSDSCSDTEEAYAPIWEQTGSTSAGQGAVTNGANDLVVTKEAIRLHSGTTLSGQSVTRPISNVYVDMPEQQNGPVSNGSLSPRQLTFVSGTSVKERSLPAPRTTTPPLAPPHSASTPNLESSVDEAFSRKCAEVDATNPLLVNTGSPPPYSASGTLSGSSYAPQAANGAASSMKPPEYTVSPVMSFPPATEPVVFRRQQSLLSDMQQLRSPLERCKSLKQTQVELLQKEMNNSAGIFIQVKRADCFQTLAVVDLLGAVWIAGWAYAQKPFLHNAFHIGDQIVSVGGHVIKTAYDVHKIIKHSPPHQKVAFNIRRVPHGHVLAIVRTFDKENLGFHRMAGTAEIVSVIPNGLAAEFGLTSKATTLDGSSLCNWMLTEVNMRPLNLFFKDNEIEHRLNAVGKDISIMVQPSDFIHLLKKKLKSVKNYKDYLVM